MLTMKKTLLQTAAIDERAYPCSVLRYDAKQECLYLALEEDPLSSVSLDAVYECHIQEEQRGISCTGRIRERFCHEAGKVLKLELENGFYKN